MKHRWVDIMYTSTIISIAIALEFKEVFLDLKK